MAPETFSSWMHKVNNIIFSKLGVDSEDLTDYTWLDQYEDGATPEEAVEAFHEEVLIYEGVPEGFF